MPGPRVLIILDAAGGWSRGILKGFAAVAHEQGWTLLHYHPDVDLEWVAREWHPAAIVLRPRPHGALPARLFSCPVVAVNDDYGPQGVASVCLDEDKIADLAVAHLLSKGLTHLTSFRFTDDPFALTRERRFCATATALGARLWPVWWTDDAELSRAEEHPAVMVSWLRRLPRPCGVFAGCDGWSRIVARYARVADIRIPEDIALVGVDNDTVECELTAPPLTSVAVPWRAVGEAAARLVQRALAGERIVDERIVVKPLDVVARRSSDVLAVGDPLVARAVTWIYENAPRRITMSAVARAVSTSRQRLERRFRAVLGRTIMQEVRRAHVEIAKPLLSKTRLELSEVARRSGFTNAALMSVAFRREVGEPPGAYRRRLRELDPGED